MVSQKDKVIKQLQTKGYVDNFWAIDNYILRLSGLIFTLKSEYMVKKIKIYRAYEKDITNPPSRHLNRKKYYYMLSTKAIKNKDNTYTLK